ncbi:hybrid sensor histidine kinase/response regulator [Geoalkalibacter sp.]|uniref:hybrid sensor histidine kinase/response regulator n=1 Tax=Geoalkalibacter sp. TaxID=3041440 RepID=UPI00272DE8B6|nr:hybrid sensor histidine kinase/response regulator [Geoalkalibacter sp.]
MSHFAESTLRFFLEEAAEHLAVLESALLRLEKEPGDLAAIIEELFRAAHTLKGSAALVKLNDISRVAHRLEDALEAARDGKHRAVDLPEQIAAMLFALDRLRDLVRLAAEGREAPADLHRQVEARFQGIRGPDEPRAPAAETLEAVVPGVVKVGADKLEALMSLLGEATVAKTHLVDQLAAMRDLREEIQFSGKRLLREVGNFSERYAYALPEQARQADTLISEFQELEFDRYDELNLFSRKLQEITSDINEALGATRSFFAAFAEKVEEFDRLLGDMKERVSEARMVRIGILFQRFSRTVRELSRDSGKVLELRIAGEETLIDRVVFDGLYEPLLHILRNAVAHGLESPAERLAAGKPETGTLRLSARRLGGSVAVEVSDDGRGIQLERVRRRAEEKGFLAPGAAISERELMQMIFRHGFSTAEGADKTSGRGVGMNVVMDRLAALNGTIDIRTEAGRGTTLVLSLPQSLAIVNVIEFRVAGQLFVIPANLVSEILDLPSAEFQGGALVHRGAPVELIDLKQLFQLPGEAPRPRFAILTQSAGKAAALLVDAVLGQEDTLIRPFGAFVREIPHLSGTSLAGNGSLRLVLNPARLLSQPLAAPQAIAVAPAGPVCERAQVLVVDDSLSVRKYAGMMLAANGFAVLTASHGLEALEILDAQPVDFILTDLEMPVMHGYELLRELGRRGVLGTTPVAVLSSRAGRQHQDKALSLGACAYLVKPFDENALVGLIRERLAQKQPA